MGAIPLIALDAFDRRAWEAMRRASARLESLENLGERFVPGFGALLFDLFAALFKLSAVLAPEALTPESGRLRRRLLQAFLDSPHFDELRKQTALDEFRAAMAAASVGERIVRGFRGEEWIDGEEMARGQVLQEREGELEKIRESLATLRDLGRTNDPLADALLAEGEIVADEIWELAERNRTSVDELPPGVDAMLNRAAEQLAPEVQRAEEALEAWATGIGAPARMSAAERLELGERLLSSEKLRRLSTLVGAMRTVALAERRHRFERAVDEAHAVRFASDWARVLPAELVHLRHPLRRLDLVRRFIEGTTLAYELRGEDERGRGPMVVCLDVSSSMEGAKDLWSKAVALTLLELARRDGRAFRALCFSSSDARIERFDCLERHKRWRRAVGRAIASMPEVMRLAEYFPGGGTDFEKPLDAAIAALGEAPFRRGDIVLITDGECDVSAVFRERFARQKSELDARLHAVLVDIASHRGGSLARPRNQRGRWHATTPSVGSMPHGPLDDLADDVTTVSELTAASTKMLLRDLR